MGRQEGGVEEGVPDPGRERLPKEEEGRGSSGQPTCAYPRA